MFAITDYIVIIAFLFFIYRGAKKGFLGTLLGPILLVVASLVSYLYYKDTGDLKIALLIAIVGPFALSIFLSIAIRILQKISKKESGISPVSQFFGALINVLWSGTLLLMTIFLITIIPIKNAALEKTQADITSSKTYAMLDKLTGHRASVSKSGIKNLSNIVNDPAKLKVLRSSPEFKKLQSNEKLQQVLKDDELVLQLKNKDYANLMQNPKILALMQDKEFLKVFMELNKTLMDKPQ